MRVAQIVNQTIHYCAWFAVAMVALQLLKDIHRFLSSTPTGVLAGSRRAGI
jgi:hypothetical protein